MVSSIGFGNGTGSVDAAVIRMTEQRLPGLLRRIASVQLQGPFEPLPDQVNLGGLGKGRSPVQYGEPCAFTEDGRQLAAAQKLTGTELCRRLRSIIGKGLVEMPGLELELALQQSFEPFGRRYGHARVHG